MRTFGEPITVTHADNSQTTVVGIFTADHEAVDVSTGVVVSTVQPVLEILGSDFPEGLEQGDIVLIQEKQYIITDIRPDGHGLLKLFLHISEEGTGYGWH